MNSKPDSVAPAPKWTPSNHSWVPNALSDSGESVCRNCGLVSEAFYEPLECNPSPSFQGIPGFPSDQPSAPVSASQPSDEEVVKLVHPDARAAPIGPFDVVRVGIFTGPYAYLNRIGEGSSKESAWADARSKLAKSEPIVTTDNGLADEEEEDELSPLEQLKMCIQEPRWDTEMMTDVCTVPLEALNKFISDSQIPKAAEPSAPTVPIERERPMLRILLCRERQLLASQAEVERLRAECRMAGIGDYQANYYLGHLTTTGALRTHIDSLEAEVERLKETIATLRAEIDELKGKK